jgi:hypothetical protein
MLSVIYADCHLCRLSLMPNVTYKQAPYADCRYAVCRCVECRGAPTRGPYSAPIQRGSRLLTSVAKLDRATNISWCQTR